MAALPEHSRVVLTGDIADQGPMAGDVGVIIHIHGDGEAYIVEFPNEAIPTVTADQVRPLGEIEILHVREEIQQ